MAAANPDPTSGKNLAYAMGTLALIVIIQRVFKGFMATVAVLAGLVIGTAVAFFLGDATFDSVADPRLVRRHHAVLLRHPEVLAPRRSSR